MPAVTASDVLVRVKLAVRCSPSRSSDVPVSVPVPVQPLTVKVLPLPVSVRLAVVIPLKAQRHAVGDRQRRVGQGEVGRCAVTDRRSPCAGQRPAPVQPLTVKVLPLPVAVRLAVVMPLKASDMPSVDDSDVLVRV